LQPKGHAILGNAKDALFDLMDAVLVTPSVYSFAELSVSPVFRRQWSSVYEAIQDGNPPRRELMKLYIKHIKQTSDIAADKLMRLRSNRLLYGAPPPYRGTGRPRVHGDKFKLNDWATWWTANQIIEVNDAKMGRLSIRLWCNLHFQQSKDHSMNLIQIERLDEFGVPKMKPLWLAWNSSIKQCIFSFVKA
jgi:hypothetical protein